MTCRELIDFIIDYLDGDLPQATREAFERHLKICRSCVNYLATYRQTIELGRAAMSDEALAAKMPEDLVKAIVSACAPLPPKQG